MTTAPQDYPFFTSNVTFRPEQMIQIVTVFIMDDDVLENVENFSVMITGQDRVEGGWQNAQILIYEYDDCETETLF